MRAFLFRLLVALFSLAAPVVGGATREELAAAKEWYAAREWPEVRGSEYAEVADPYSFRAVDGKQQRMLRRGFILGENEKELTFLPDGTSPRMFGDQPFVVEQVPKYAARERGEREQIRRIPLEQGMKEMILKWRRRIEAKDFPFSFEPLSDRTVCFLLGRICERQGRGDLAEMLDATAMEVPASEYLVGEVKVGGDLVESIEREYARVLMARAIGQCGDPKITRGEMLAEFQRVIRYYPRAEQIAMAREMAGQLERMIAEDVAHVARPLDELSPEERARELIFRLRDQPGHQFTTPGRCEIFDPFRQYRGGGEDTPADELVKLGHAAVPALIAALEDARLSRALGTQRGSGRPAYVLRIGDCAGQILEKLAGFYLPGLRVDERKPSAQRDNASRRETIETWWRSVREKGEAGVLREVVAAGRETTREQVERLIEVDPAGALKVIAAGVEAAESRAIERTLVEPVAQRLETPEAREFLRERLQKSAILSVRVEAARALFRAGEEWALEKMLAEWRAWKSPAPFSEEESADPLIEFLARSGRRKGLVALAARYPVASVEEKFRILTALPGAHEYHESKEEEEMVKAAEAILIGALGDETVYPKMSLGRNNVSIEDPRMCDVALIYLEEGWPTKYPRLWTTDLRERAGHIREALAAWTAGLGQ